MRDDIWQFNPIWIHLIQEQCVCHVKCLWNLPVTVQGCERGLGVTLCGRMWEINSWLDAGRNTAVISGTELHSAGPARKQIPRNKSKWCRIKNCGRRYTQWSFILTKEKEIIYPILDFISVHCSLHFFLVVHEPLFLWVGMFPSPASCFKAFGSGMINHSHVDALAQ